MMRWIALALMQNIGIEASLAVGLAALVASTLAGVTGFGGAAVLLPVLVFAFGARDAIPILTVARLVGNGSRVWFNRHEALVTAGLLMLVREH